MAELKTKPTNQDVAAFLASIADPQKQADTHTLTALMQVITGAPLKMWGARIVGYCQTALPPACAACYDSSVYTSLLY
jgi:hypothetical protein